MRMSDAGSIRRNVQNPRRNVVLVVARQRQGLVCGLDVEGTGRGLTHLSSWENLSRGDLSVMAAELLLPRRRFTTLKLCLSVEAEQTKGLDQRFRKSCTSAP